MNFKTDVDIEPVDDIDGTHRTGSISSSYTPEMISETLGFGPNIEDDPWKVTHSWGFIADGHLCAIWDFKGSRWSTYGPGHVLKQLFPLYNGDSM